MMADLLRALAHLNDHWIADLVGCVSLFTLLFGGLFLGHGMGFK
jgi:hypothetical protein